MAQHDWHTITQCNASYNSLTWQVNSSQSGDYGWSDLWGGHWGMQHYTEHTWDPKVIEAIIISAFLVI